MNIRKMNQKEKIEYMTTRPVQGLVCQLAVPTIISMLITAFYNMADTFFVGQISTQATGAVGVCFSVMALIQAFGFFFGQGSGSFISRSLGAGEYKKSDEMAACGFFFAFISGMLVAVLGNLFLEPISLVLGSTATILPLTKDYLRLILVGAPFMMASLCMNNQLRFQGSAAYSMVGITIGGLVNLGLDPLFIFVLDMGVAGAALATSISQFTSFVILLAMSYRGSNIRIRLSNFRPNMAYIREIVRGGMPSLFRQGLASLSQMMLNNVAGNYGDAAIAAMSIVNRVSMCANSALIGFGQGFQPVCGMNYGAKKYARVREAFFFCVKVGVVFLVGVSIVGLLFAEPIITIFRKDDLDVIRIGTTALWIHCFVFPLNVFVVMGNMMMQSIGKAFRASLLSAARQGVFFLPLILILPFCFGLLGVQICQSVADICAFLLALPLTFGVLREMKQMEKGV